MIVKLNEWPVGTTLSHRTLKVPDAWMLMLVSEAMSLAKDHADLPKGTVTLDVSVDVRISAGVPIEPVPFSASHNVNVPAAKEPPNAP